MMLQNLDYNSQQDINQNKEINSNSAINYIKNLQLKINKLIEENENLKNIIQQNNYDKNLFSRISRELELCKNKIRFNDAPNLKVLFNYFSSINWLIYGYLLKNQHIFFCYLFGAILSIL